MSTDRRLIGRSVLVGVAALALSACTIPTSADEVAPTTQAPATATTTVPEPVSAPAGMDQFAPSFDAFSDGLGGAVGIAVTPVGGGPVQTAGKFSGGAAWSTIKVPLAIAALNQDAGLGAAAGSAITASDNAAAEQLWASLGADEDAAMAVEGVLQRLGDTSTTVPSTRARPEYSIFGQSSWAAADQARFGSALPCEPEAADVYALMGQIFAGQSWGLGALPGAHFKGGWGPGLTGGYLVRQLGVIDTPTEQLAVAIAADTPGTFEDGIALLNQVAGWIAANPALLPAGGHC